MLSWNEFQAWVKSKMAKNKPHEMLKMGFALGLSGESGEYADIIKKEVMHDRPDSHAHKLKELGDILFYVAACAEMDNLALSDCVNACMSKLNARYPAGFDPTRSHAPGETPTEEQNADHGNWPESAGSEGRTDEDVPPVLSI